MRSVLCSVFLIALFTDPAAARRPTVDDVMSIHNVTEATLSPDERWIVFARTETDLDADTHSQHLWLVSSDGGTPRRLTRSGTWNATVQWFADNQRVAFVSDRRGKNQVFMIYLDGGEATALTRAERGVGAYRLHPRGTSLAYTTREPADPHRGPRHPGDELNMSHLHVVDVESGVSRQLTHGSYTVGAMSYSPDGGRIVYSRQDTPRVIDWFFTSDLFVIDVASGEDTPLVIRPGMDSAPVWSPRGDQIAFFSQDGVENWIGTTHVCVVDAQTGETRNLTPQVQERIYQWDLSFAWAADGKHLYFGRPQGVVNALWRIDVKSTEATTLGPEGVFGAFSTGQRGKKMVLVESTPTLPGEAYVVDLKRGVRDRITASNPQLGEMDFAPAQRLQWSSFDDREIEGVYFAPAEGSPSPAPLVVVLHGGPSGHMKQSFSPQTGLWMAQSEIYAHQIFAATGFAVLLPNFRGSGAYGTDHLYANLQDWGYGDLQDVLAGIDHLTQRGIVDPHRVGVMGWSYGGTLTAFALTQTDRFAAASVGAGVTNHISAYGTMDIPPFLEAYFGGTPWEVPQNYLRSSTMNFADRISTPTLLLYGENDRRVPMGQGHELYRTLEGTDVPVEMVVYPRSGHAVFEPQLQRDLFQRNLDWFQRWLTNEPADRSSRR